MIIDSHHHLWNYSPADYPWMDDSMHMLQQDYLPADFQKTRSHTEVEGSVVVQARPSLEETRWLLEQADQFDFIKGVVGWVDLCADQVEAQLEEFSGHPRLLGIRHPLQDEPDQEYMLRPEFIRGLKLLGKYHLTYDLLIYPGHLKPAIKLVSLLPDQPFVLDHLAKPLIQDGMLDPWEKDIMQIADRQNVLCKVSGLITEADWKNWKYEDFIPYLAVITAGFGTKRLMFGSDWPVCRLAGDYHQVFSLCKDYFSDFSQSEQAGIFGENCRDFYQI